MEWLSGFCRVWGSGLEVSGSRLQNPKLRFRGAGIKAVYNATLSTIQYNGSPQTDVLDS